MGKNPSKPKNQAGAQETPEDLKRLEESFDRVFSGRNAFQREYLLVEEAKQWDMPLDEYRKLFESYCIHTLKYGWVRKFRLSTLPRLWKWTGIAEKKLWDYMQLGVGISIPIVIFIAGQYFTKQTNDQQQEIANKRYGQDLLSKYFDQMTNLITKENLLVPNKDHPDEPTASQTIARARTLSTLRELGKDGDRKGLLIKFLSEANLIGEVNLESADISGANLTRANLSEVNLREANLREVNLREVNLREANLREANLIRANLRVAYLSGANLIRANLRGADLSGVVLWGADLSGADLSGANLIRVDLMRVDLDGVDLNRACLKQAKNLTTSQVKSAQHWEDAYYSRDFRKQLGLPPDTRRDKWCPDSE